MMDNIEFETKEIYLLKEIFELAYKSAHLCEDEYCARKCISEEILHLEEKVSLAIGTDIDANCCL